MRRVVIVGNSGSGKTTLAATLAQRLDVPHIELDSLFHQPGWTPTPTPRFRAAVGAALDRADTAAGGWVICGNYAAVRTLVWARADTVVWLDLSRRVVMGRVVRRTIRRLLGDVELWNGNRESARMALALHDPERSIVRWTWEGVHRYRSLYEPMLTDSVWAELGRHRLSSPAEVAAWLAQVRQQPPRST